MKLHKYSFPNIDCAENSAWHEWSRKGAIFAYGNQGANYKKAAHEFACEDGRNTVDSGRYSSRFSAFMQGVSYLQLLKVESA